MRLHPPGPEQLAQLLSFALLFSCAAFLVGPLAGLLAGPPAAVLDPFEVYPFSPVLQVRWGQAVGPRRGGDGHAVAARPARPGGPGAVAAVRLAAQWANHDCRPKNAPGPQAAALASAGA